MKSLRGTLLVTILVGLLSVLVLSGAAVMTIAGRSLHAQFDDALAAKARAFASLVGYEQGVLELDHAGDLSEADLGVLLRITGPDAHVIAQSPDWPEDHADPAPSPAPDAPPILSDTHASDGASARAVAIAALVVMDSEDLTSTGPASGRGEVVVVRVIGRTEAVTRARSALLAALIAGGFFAAAGAGAAVWLGVRRGLVPLHRLGRELDLLSAHDLTLPSASACYPAELRPIAGALAGLLDRLRAGLERERRFTDAAAHELRTPIAELKAVSDVARRWPEPDRLRQAIAEAGAIADEMEALLESLLAAARAGSDSRAAGPVAILPLVRAVAQPGMEACRARGVTFAFEGDANACFRAPRGALLAVVRNLVENAAEYTPAGGGVRVRAGANNGSTYLEVENGPVTLDPAHVDRMFEPFWRADESRTDRRHRGLGLAIVASLCEGLRLRREASVTPDGNLRVRLST